MRYFLPILSLFLLLPLAAQATGLPTIRVVDEKGDAVPFAHVEVKDGSIGEFKVYGVTDENGTILLEGEVQEIRVSCLGYEPLELSIGTDWNGLIRLRESIQSLEELVVTGQFKPVPVEQSLFNVKVLDSKAIQQRGTTSLSDLMVMELNTRIVNDNILGSSIILQGMSGQNVKILIDGVPMITGEAGEFDLSQLNMNNVERVEIIEGPLSVQYGTNALAGTINVITKDLPDHKKYFGSVNLLYETIGQYNFDLQGGTSIGKNKIFASGGRNQFTGFSSTGEPRSMNWNPKTQYNGNLRVTRKVGKLNLGVVYNGFLEESLSKSNPDPSTNFTTANDNLFTTRRSNVNLYVNGRIGRNGYLDLINNLSYYSRDTRRYLVNVADESRKTLNNVFTDFSTYTFRGSYSQNNMANGRVSMQAGYDINLNYAAGERMASEGHRLDDIGIFTSILFNPLPQLEIQPAFRVAYNSEYDTRDINFLNAGLPVIPSLNIKYQLRERGAIRLSYAKGFRAPSLRELFWDFEDANHSISGNTELQPEIADNFIFSANYIVFKNLRHRLDIAPMAFYNDVENKIELVDKDRSTLPPHRQNVNVARTYANIPPFRTKGFNLGITYQYNNILKIKPGMGVLARSGSNSLGNDFYSWEATTQAALWLQPFKTSINLFYKYNGPLAQFSLSREGELQDRTLMDYHLMDISATRSFKNDHIAITAGVKNLFNVTDVLQVGEGSEGLVPRSGFKNMLPVERGTNAFIRVSTNF